MASGNLIDNGLSGGVTTSTASSLFDGIQAPPM
jgi:hypothetical protein